MTVKGNLIDMSLDSIISINCNDMNQALLRIKHQGIEGDIYLADGSVVHAVLDTRIGKEVIYEMLTWEDGEFELENDIEPPERTITTSWSSLLLEGMRLIDERVADPETTVQNFKTKEMNTMSTKKKSEMIYDALSEGLEASIDIESGAVVGIDGMVLGAIVSGKLAEDTLGAQAAAFYGIAKRASADLGRGKPYQAVIQSDNGNIVVTAIDERTVFVGTTIKDATLGMVFRESLEIAESILPKL